MNMRLLAADLSLGRPSSFASSSTTLSTDHDPSNCLLREQFYTHPMTSDLHALEVYHKALEDERLKIQAFERELPFCMQLLDDAIEASKEQLEERLTCKLNTPLHEAPTHHEFVCKYTSSLTKGAGTFTPTVGEINLHFKRKWTCSLPPPLPPDMVATTSFEPTRWLLQKTTSPAPTKDTSHFFELKECSCSDHATTQAVDQMQETSTLMISSSASHHPNNAKQFISSMRSICGEPMNMDKVAVHSRDKADDVNIKDPDDKRRCIQAMPASMAINMPALINGNLNAPNSYSRSISITKLGPQELHINTGLSSPLAKTTSSAGRSPMNLQPGSVQRKPRRCWSPELHQRFLTALNRLGGCQVATPKQIRELMNVEGLTNDEVKSHLQKYRLHMRRPNGAVASSAQSSSPQTAGHHLLVFGHIWVPPEYDEQHQENLNVHASKDLPGMELCVDDEVQVGAMQISMNTNNKTERDHLNIEEGDTVSPLRAASANINIDQVTPAHELDSRDNHDQHKRPANVSCNFPPPRPDAINLSDATTHVDATAVSAIYHIDEDNSKELLHLMHARDHISSTASHTNINLRERDARPAKIADFTEFDLTMGCSRTESRSAGVVPGDHAEELINQGAPCNATDKMNRTPKGHHNHDELIA